MKYGDRTEVGGNMYSDKVCLSNDTCLDEQALMACDNYTNPVQHQDEAFVQGIMGLMPGAGGGTNLRFLYLCFQNDQMVVVVPEQLKDPFRSFSNFEKVLRRIQRGKSGICVSMWPRRMPKRLPSASHAAKRP